MPSTAIACGLLLILIGIVGYVHGIMSGHASITALIPAIFGLILLLLGVAARIKADLRKHLMHAAAAAALLGFILPAGRLGMKLGELSLSAAVVSQVSMMLVCLLFVVLAIRSFISARRQNEAH